MKKFKFLSKRLYICGIVAATIAVIGGCAAIFLKCCKH